MNARVPDAANLSVDETILDAYEEVVNLIIKGEAVDESYLQRRYPQQATELASMLPAMYALATVSDDAQLGDRGDDPQLAATPRVLGDYRLVREIGRGGMGVVYEAEQVSLARRVALKVLPFAAILDQRQLQRFHNEAMAAANLDHPHIVDVHGVGCERGVHFYVMRYVPGTTLAAAIEARRRSQEPGARSEKGKAEGKLGSRNSEVGSEELNATSDLPLPNSEFRIPSLADTSLVAQAALSTVNIASPKERFRRIVELGVQAAGALEHAHQFGVVHRDIKPSNLLLDESGKLWITDFGLAQVDSHATLTLPGDVLGTLRYMSPEQAAGRPTMVDHRTDIYSLGATLYELATNRPVVEGQDRAEILREIAETNATPPRKLTPGMPADLETILLKCLDKEPSARYDSALALAEDLRRFLDEKPVLARRPGALERSRRWARRHFDRLASAAAGIVLALAFAVVALTFQQAKTNQANEDLIAEQGRTRLALADAERNRDLADRRAQSTLRAVDYARRRQHAIYQIHLLDGTVNTARGGPDWLAEIVGPEHVTDFEQIVSVHLEPTEAGSGLAFLAGLDELQYLYIDGAQGFRVTDDDLTHIGKLAGLQLLLLKDVGITDEGLKHLAPLTELQSLRLAYVPITDRGLKHLDLDRKQELGSLMLEGTQVTDAGLAEVAQCDALWMLLLDETAVGDAGLERLKTLSGLRDLMLNRTRVSDAGLVHLAGLPRLRTLYLNSTAVTDDGLLKLQSMPLLDDVAAFDTAVTEAGASKMTEGHPERRVGFGATPDEASPESDSPQ